MTTAKSNTATANHPAQALLRDKSERCALKTGLYRLICCGTFRWDVRRARLRRAFASAMTAPPVRVVRAHHENQEHPPGRRIPPRRRDFLREKSSARVRRAKAPAAGVPKG